MIRQIGLAKHGQILQMLKRDLGMGHGDANALAGTYLKGGMCQYRVSLTEPDQVDGELMGWVEQASAGAG